MSDNKKNYYPPMHTAEHILNKTMVNMFGCERSEKCHIEKKKSRCYFDLNNAPDKDEIIMLEEKINDVINNHNKVTEKFMDFDEAEKFFNLSRINKKENPSIRVISVGDYDDCPCIGEHVSNTNEIENFRITSTSYKDGVFKVRFKV